MRVEEFLALPMMPSIRLRIGPTEAVDIDQMVFESKKEELIGFCLQIPNSEGMNWEILRTYTGGNGQMAKVLIALGDLCGVWQMYPPLDWVDLWRGNTFYPSIRMHTVMYPKLAPVVDNFGQCECCGRPTQIPSQGKPNEMCLECEICCDEEFCAVTQSYRKDVVEKTKEAAAIKVETLAESHSDLDAPFDMEEYLRGINRPK